MNFKELPTDGQAFEQLIRELLFRRGLHVQWSGRGQDGGRDLLCVETLQGLFIAKPRTWLVQCKHNAHSGASVGVADLDDIVVSCAHHGATGYLLACSTQPSSTVVERLEAITANPAVVLDATYWDAVTIERLLSNQRDWAIAQRFMPASCGEWKLYATDRPNEFVAHYKGYVFNLTNRIGCETGHHLPSIAARIADIEAIALPEHHFIRIRAVWYDDKNGGYTWYIDYMRPYKSSPAVSCADVQDTLQDGWALEDGQIYSWDVRAVEYLPSSDHYDKDHYEYYVRYTPNFLEGRPRAESWDEYYSRRQEIEELENRQNAIRNQSFEAMVACWRKVPFIRHIAATNAQPEAIRHLGGRWKLSEARDYLEVDLNHLFSAKLVLFVQDEGEFHRLMAYVPIGFGGMFRLGKIEVYTPDQGRDLDDELIYDLHLSLHPVSMLNRWNVREKLNSYFDAIAAALESFLAGEPLAVPSPHFGSP
jgi:hypothetical protein